MPSRPAAHSRWHRHRAARVVWLVALLAGAGGLAARAAAADFGSIRMRAEQGDPAALTALGAAYADGRDLPTDYPRALAYFSRAAAAGSAPAEYNLGLMCEAGRGTPPDLAAAFGHYERAAWQGLAPAEFNVGNMYASGRGVAPDPFAAVFWLRQAALKNLPEAEYNLALAYEFGRGIPKDEGQALHWYRAASAQGYAPAEYNLALMLADGRGTPVDLAAAAGLLRQAGLQGFVAAQNDYGVALAAGRGFGAPGLGPAYAWLSLAVENGTSPHNRDIVGRKLSAAQRMEAAIQLGQLHAEAGRPRAVWEGTAGRGDRVTGPDAPLAGTLALTADEPLTDLRRDPESSRAGNAGALNLLAVMRPDALLDQGLSPVAGLRPPPFASSDTAALRAAQARIDELRSSLAAVRSELAGAQRMADASGRLAAEQADAREALAKEKAALAQHAAAEAQATAEQTKALAVANDKLQGQVREQTEANAGLTRQLEALRAAREPVTALPQQLEALKAENQRLAGLPDQLASAENRARTAEKAADAARTDLQAAHAALADAQARLAAREQPAPDHDLAGRVQELAQANAGLVAQLDALKAENARLAPLAGELETAERQAQSARRAADQAQMDLLAAQARLAGSGRAGVAVVAPLPAPAPELVEAAPPPPTAPTPPAAPPSRTYVVQDGDSLSRISQRSYGTRSRWREIFDANRDILDNENSLRPGQRLKLP
jgi:TPR repeat protein/nucleoid-associated protein YgaU